MTEENGSTDILAPADARVLSAKDVLRHVKLIEEVKAAVMKDGTHYGRIPGCGDKETLLKPGAEKLLLTFGLATCHDIVQRDLGNGHREYEVRTVVKSGTRLVAEGVGTCSTMEKKYRYRDAPRRCPKCGKAGSIIKGKAEYGGGWLCWKKKEGCDAKFKDGDESIEKQQSGQVENPDIADQYNTVLKMAKKRSLVDASLTATASSDFFAQDLEDLDAKNAEFVVVEEQEEKKRARKAPAPKPVEVVAQAPAAAPETPIGQEIQRIYDEPQTPEDARNAQKVMAAPAEPLSWRKLTLAEWKALSEEERIAKGDITRKQCAAVASLAKAQGLADYKSVLKVLADDFPDEWNDWEVVDLWQLNSKVASFAIDHLRGA